MSKREKSRLESALDHFHGMKKVDLADSAVNMFEELEELRKPCCESDNRKEPLAAVVDCGRLVVTIGLDTLDAIRKHDGTDFSRVSAADIAEFLTSTAEGMPTSAFEYALMEAAVRAKRWDDENEETTEPSTEFFR